ncbi:hypothetical protein [Nesterenkonia natronophila]|uniref:Nuclear transport factor 2 family protein n=1 Tax=Nesterenkonia natronophila TaxID=2174932 RepID=A0A3A4F8J5_9MICC|nr:hypothetical protein [Nesterenkonia natronophila]RJN31204.1 hypothetical protein D3250_10160 [Nesterenkonia natronophila]
MNHRAFYVGALFVFLLINSACHGDDSDSLGEPVDSVIKGVPVPVEANKHGRSGDTAAWSVRGADYEEIVAWFEDELPIDDDHDDLKFCETRESDVFVHWNWWEEAPEGHNGTPWLSVVVFQDERVNVVISYEEDDLSQCR